MLRPELTLADRGLAGRASARDGGCCLRARRGTHEPVLGPSLCQVAYRLFVVGGGGSEARYVRQPWPEPRRPVRPSRIALRDIRDRPAAQLLLGRWLEHQVVPRNAILITGPAASGTSTLARYVAQQLGWQCLSEDEHWVANGWGSGARSLEQEMVVQRQVVNDLVAECPAGRSSGQAGRGYSVCR